jgi:tubulin polyglutamylase TTLL4
MKFVAGATMISGFNSIRSHQQHYLPHRNTSCELFGIDILLDSDLNPFSLEVNISPAISGEDSKLDHHIKDRLMHDLMRM